MIAQTFLAKIGEKHDVSEAFLVDGSPSLQAACRREGYDFRHKNTEIGTALNVSFMKQNAGLSASRIVSATPQQRLPTTGPDHSASHGICLSEHYHPRNPKIFNIGDIYSRIRYGKFRIHTRA